MTPRKSLTDFEKGQITVLMNQGISNRQIAKTIGRTHTIVNSFVKDPTGYGTKKKSGRPSLLSQRDKRLIIRSASNNVDSCRQIKSDLNLDVSSETVRRTIAKSKFIKYRKMKKSPYLSNVHRVNRMKFARNHRRTDFTKIIFSDEKKFNCDGPDGYRSYWHDLRKEKLRFSRRNFKGGGVMVWAAIASTGRIKLCFVSKKMNGADYRIVLRRGLMPFWRRNRNGNFIFQQDGAPIHRARKTTEWLTRRNIPILEWPSCSPDINPIENVWAFMVRKIYEGNKTYRSVDDLKPAIIAAWREVDQQLIDNLYLSMDSRIFQLIQRSGGPTDY
ncbi:hypothetical protein CRE_19968 [Caenorhabditis remanei]|uniref:Tc1-like transposase DDE domain-containing protein n=1 Tax=Caenorhabditis remanei TaxID=31234 RepID=E3N8F6_CAERE|nr:hypothetical protein CRE_19968 [Caenorhabditis remanei]